MLGSKIFQSDTRFVESVIVLGRTDGLNLSSLKPVTLGNEQNVVGLMVFQEDITIQGNASIGALISDVDMQKLRREMVTKSDRQNILGNINLENAMKNLVMINGTVNGIDLSEFKFTDFVLTKHLMEGRTVALERLEKLCFPLEYVKNAFRGEMS